MCVCTHVKMGFCTCVTPANSLLVYVCVCVGYEYVHVYVYLCAETYAHLYNHVYVCVCAGV